MEVDYLQSGSCCGLLLSCQIFLIFSHTQFCQQQGHKLSVLHIHSRLKLKSEVLHIEITKTLKNVPFKITCNLARRTGSLVFYSCLCHAP